MNALPAFCETRSEAERSLQMMIRESKETRVIFEKLIKIFILAEQVEVL